MNPGDVKRVRDLFAMEQGEFARFMNVDNRTVLRWETGIAAPAGSAIAILRGLEEGFMTARDPLRFMNIVRSSVGIGGVAYLIVKLTQMRERLIYAEGAVSNAD